jgi:hypothetical protein
VEGIIEKDTLTRLDILSGDHALVPAILFQEREFPCEGFEEIHAGIKAPSHELTADLQNRADAELRFRSELVARHRLGLGEELFFFGRPYFQLLQALGFAVGEGPAGLILSWRGRHGGAR